MVWNGFYKLYIRLLRSFGKFYSRVVNGPLQWQLPDPTEKLARLILVYLRTLSGSTLGPCGVAASSVTCSKVLEAGNQPCFCGFWGMYQGSFGEAASPKLALKSPRSDIYFSSKGIFWA